MYYMNRDLQEVKVEYDKSYGRPSIGGDFSLINHNGERVSSSDFRGKWLLMYFGFCRCPDICPEQIEKLIEVYDRLKLVEKPKYQLIPIFVSVDPERDTPEMMAQYVKEFSPDLIGLTGTKEEIANLSRLYKIYYSAGPKDNDGDYIVDHTVIMYLIDSEGKFLNYYGQLKPVRDIINDIKDKMNKT